MLLAMTEIYASSTVCIRSPNRVLQVLISGLQNIRDQYLPLYPGDF